VAAALAGALALAALPVGPAWAGSGGIGTPGGDCKRTGDARISNGLAIPPCNAPRRVKRVMAAANDIAKGKGYCLGGGHSGWRSPCYDCSGSVSYALHGGDLISSPEPSGALESWGRKGRGTWITVYANGGHAFMTIAGLRFDTSDTPGAGPGWASTMGYENPADYVARHFGRL